MRKLRENPISGYQLPAEGDAENYCYTPAEVRSICKLSGSFFGDVFRFLALTGLREGELMWLTNEAWTSIASWYGSAQGVSGGGTAVGPQRGPAKRSAVGTGPGDCSQQPSLQVRLVGFRAACVEVVLPPAGEARSL